MASDFVITMNSGALLSVKKDLWITELGPYDDYGGEDRRSIVIEMTHRLARHAQSENPNVICILKNVWPLNLSVNSFDIVNQFSWIRDFLLRFEPTNSQLKKILKAYFSSKNLLVPQIHSTALTAVLIASKIGFKRIFIHGIDGNGPHFFHSEILDGECVTCECSLLLAWAREVHPRLPAEINYVPGIETLALLNRYIDVLKEFGVHVTKVGSDSS